jgi:hypothetical protein
VWRSLPAEDRVALAGVVFEEHDALPGNAWADAGTGWCGCGRAWSATRTPSRYLPTSVPTSWKTMTCWWRPGRT